MSTRVVELAEQSARPWDDYVDNHPQGTLFHTLLWRDAVCGAFGHQSRYLAAWRSDRLVGVFPLILVESRLAGRIMISVPYAVYGGTLAEDDEAHAALLDSARQMAEKIRCQWIDIRSIQPQWPDLPVVRRYVTFRKPLPDDPARVLAELPRKARAAARQARERYRLETVFDDTQLDTVWSL
ncbi:MAG TPA: FemAB-like protein, partial [Phycisphaerae bacterium]|nr:FemAB-like protein [Phycisphaerae bacterium]